MTLGYNGKGFGSEIVITTNDGGHTTTLASYDTFDTGLYYSPELFPAKISVAYDSKKTKGGDDNDSTD